jgi:c-di-GMP-binding flagellar brake protein YcgR
MSGETPKGIDRRETERKYFRTTAHLLLTQTDTVPVRTIDISVTGLAIVAAANPRPNTFVMIRVAIPTKGGGSLTYRVQTRVVHSVLSRDHGGFKVGLQFVEPMPELVAAIEAYIKG